MTYKEVLKKIAAVTISDPYNGGMNAAAKQKDMQTQAKIQQRMRSGGPGKKAPKIKPFDANHNAFMDAAAKWRQQFATRGMPQQMPLNYQMPVTYPTPIQ